MASVAKDGKGWRILFMDPDGKRKTLRLGAVDKKSAVSIRVHVEALLEARITGQPLRQETAVWLGRLSVTLRKRLARCGLADTPPDTLLLGEAVQAYLARQQHIKPASRCASQQALSNLVTFFGLNRRLDTITPGEGDDFVRWLLSGARRQRKGTPGLRPATVLKRLERVRAFFRDAVRRRLLMENPFADTRGPRLNDRERQVYVPVAIVERLIDATPSLEWRLLLAMARYLGVRVPSEPFSMTWDCVDWERGLIRVPSPKTQAHGKPDRLVPMVPPVRPHIERLFDATPAGRVWIFHELRQRDSMRQAERGWWHSVNLRQHLLRLIKRIGERPWPRLWHSLRASAETDLAARFPLHVVAAWLGNTPKIAVRHYLRVTPDDYASAVNHPWRIVDTEQNGGTKSGALTAQNAAQQAPAMRGKIEKPQA